MITPVIINRLQWKAYLIFMCTNFCFAPIVYFFYPETARMSLEEIDFLFITNDKGPVRLSKELAKERKKHGHVSIVADTGVIKEANVTREAEQGKMGTEGVYEHIEN